MKNEQVRRMIEDTYDDSREDTIWSMVSEFYSRKMLSIAILVWAFGIIFFGGAAYCGVEFFKADQTKHQIMYASIFVLFLEGIALMKIFAWQMLARNSIKREIKRLELRVAELARSVGEKS